VFAVSARGKRAHLGALIRGSSARRRLGKRFGAARFDAHRPRRRGKLNLVLRWSDRPSLAWLRLARAARRIVGHYTQADQRPPNGALSKASTLTTPSQHFGQAARTPARQTLAQLGHVGLLTTFGEPHLDGNETRTPAKMSELMTLRKRTLPMEPCTYLTNPIRSAGRHTHRSARDTTAPSRPTSVRVSWLP
jgi:hypothetical protein